MSSGATCRGWFGRIGAVIASAAFASASALAQQVELPAAKGGDDLRDITRTKPSELGLKVDEKLGAPLPLELAFTDSEGRRRVLAEFFTRKGPGGEEIKGKAAVVAMVYYRCPVICSALLKTVNECVRDIKGLDAGVDFNVLTFSFDPRDDLYAAQNQRKASLMGYNRGDGEPTASGWNFFLHDEGGTRQLANAFGFQYSPINGGQDFAHPVVFFLVTPDGKISRYLYGFGHTALQMRLAILDAGQGTITPSLEDQFLTFCYMFDPKMGMYTLSAIRVMQLGGIITLIGLGGLIGVMLIGERMKRSRQRATQAKSVGALGARTRVSTGGLEGKTAT
jgi:protein SCO1/2